MEVFSGSDGAAIVRGNCGDEKKEEGVRLHCGGELVEQAGEGEEWKTRESSGRVEGLTA